MIVLSTNSASDALAAWVQAIGSIAAIVAAIFIATGQERSRRSEQKRLLARKDRAARAAAPFALSAICDWSRQQMKIWQDAVPIVVRRSENENLTDEVVLFVDVPRDHFDHIRNIVEHSSKRQAYRYIALLNEMQVHYTRSKGFNYDLKNINLNIEADYCLAQMAHAAEIYARATDLFDHARDEVRVKNITVSKSKVRAAFHLCGFYRGADPDLDRVINGLYK